MKKLVAVIFLTLCCASAHSRDLCSKDAEEQVLSSSMDDSGKYRTLKTMNCQSNPFMLSYEKRLADERSAEEKRMSERHGQLQGNEQYVWPLEMLGIQVEDGILPVPLPHGMSKDEIKNRFLGLTDKQLEKKIQDAIGGENRTKEDEAMLVMVFNASRTNENHPSKDVISKCQYQALSSKFDAGDYGINLTSARADVEHNKDGITDSMKSIFHKCTVDRVAGLISAEQDEEKAAAEAEQLEEQRQKLCGKYPRPVEIGMSEKLLKLGCAGDAILVGKDKNASVYRMYGLLVSVYKGKVVRWIRE